MCTSKWLFGVLALAVLLGCGSDLTLPGEGPPAGNPPEGDAAPAQLLAWSGSGQAARVGKRLHDPLVVRLTDQSNQPVSGAVVEFSFKDAIPEAELDPAEAETDENGHASVEVRLGSIAGQYQVEASLAATDLRATFDVTALERDHRDQGDNGGDDDDDDD
jgi:Bacterial Ig-like domain (group 1)